jgi:hypothetical protein
MPTAPIRTIMPALPRAGQKVCWRHPLQARACGWEDLFGPGPFEVVRLVDHSAHGLATGLVLLTNLGEQEIDEVWLALAEEPKVVVSPAPSPRTTARARPRSRGADVGRRR